MSEWSDWTLQQQCETDDIVELDDTVDDASVPLAWPVIGFPAIACSGGVATSAFRQFFDDLPFAVYSVDTEGRLTYFNPASVEFAGRLPMLGKDKWCVSWKLYSAAGQFIRHDECPMAVAIQDGRSVRGVTAIAERPNGRRVPFMPFPTPIRDGNGRVVGGMNMLVAI